MVKSKRAREAEAAVPVEDVPSDDVPAKKRKRSDDDQKHDVKKSKKDKKDKHKKESRRERKDKRRDLQDLPEQEDEEEEEAVAAEKSVPMTGADADSEQQPDAAGEPNEKKAKKDKKKKEKKDKESKEETKEEKKDKKDKKKKEKKDKKAQAESNDTTTTSNETVTNTATPENAEDDDTSSNKKKDRHIVFVGNLPFSATVASITAHFSSLSPISVRCLRNRDDPNPCRGIAFVEFAQVWHMRTCLDKFHHSLFDDGVSPARRINVELTAGGGGKTKQRTQKIREKNHKLNENRAKRIEREKTAKTATVDAAPADGAHMEDAIHPSRRARVPGNKY